ncbi:MAG: DUF2206 domain-containing protein [Patescibacteria group bacterium]|nr:DUF2206 domain-containing protein [Patescibacteria group bacterium]
MKKIQFPPLPRITFSISWRGIVRFLTYFTIFNALMALTVGLALANGGNPVLQIIAVLLIVFIPGILLTRIIRLTGPPGVLAGYAVAFGLAYLIYLGLLQNMALPYLGVQKPLTLFPFIITFAGATWLLFVYSLLRGNSYAFALQIPTGKPVSIIFAVIPCLFPLLTLAGSFRLNNGADGMPTFLALSGMAVYLLAAVFARNKIAPWVFPWAIFCMGAALLYMYSARTPFLHGWDIQSEYRVFERTLQRGFWKPGSSGDIYNATLGITILPSLFATVFTGEPFLIFKYLYPFFFAFTGIAVYYLLEPRLPRTAAFLASFLVICQQSFASMPSLARQEIAFIMFVYMLLVLFDRLHNRVTKSDVMLFLGGAMVLSHYSTTYVALILFTCTLLAGTGVRLYFHFFPKLQIPDARFMLSWLVVLILGLFTVLWYGYYTRATGNLNNLVQSIRKNIVKLLKEEARSSQSVITVTGTVRPGDGRDLRAYIDSVMRRYRFDPNNLSFYPLEVAQQYPVQITRSQSIQGDPVLQPLAFSGMIAIRQLIKILMVLGLIIGALMFLFKRKLIVDAEWLIMGYAYMLMIVLVVVIPEFSGHYNIERLYQQGLMLLAFFPVFFYLFVWRKRLVTLKYIVLGIVISIFFFSHHGMVAQIFGGEPTINLNNFGAEYDQFYISSAERSAAEWYYANRDPRVTLFADTYAYLRLSSQSRLYNIIPDLLPVVFFQNGYVYATRANYRSGNVHTGFGGVRFTHTFPRDFLDENKNKVYSNRSSVIYK